VKEGSNYCHLMLLCKLELVKEISELMSLRENIVDSVSGATLEVSQNK
jgi:hypothetical protein